MILCSPYDLQDLGGMKLCHTYHEGGFLDIWDGAFHRKEGRKHSDWIGLDLFNDDTRPSGHISRPTQVNVSELLSFSKQLLKSNNIVQSGG